MYEFEKKYTYNKLMHHLDDQCNLREEQGIYTCLLKNHPNAADWFYGMAFGELTLRLHENCEVILIIATIDDGDIVLIGPREDKEKATRRLKQLLLEIKTWDKWIPTADQVQNACIRTGCYWNK